MSLFAISKEIKRLLEKAEHIDACLELDLEYYVSTRWKKINNR